MVKLEKSGLYDGVQWHVMATEEFHTQWTDELITKRWLQNKGVTLRCQNWHLTKTCGSHYSYNWLSKDTWTISSSHAHGRDKSSETWIWQQLLSHEMWSVSSQYQCSERNSAINLVEALLDTESSFWREHNRKTNSYWVVYEVQRQCSLSLRC
jgi:hypothetical protein